MKKLIVDCKSGEQEYIELSQEEVEEIENRPVIAIEPVETLEETIDEKIERIVSNKLKEK